MTPSPFEKRWLYHPKQYGSASIKAVLPCFTDLSYENLNIANGGEAMNQYAAFIQGNIPTQKQAKLWEDLTTYCKLDTYAMVKLMDVLYKESK